MSGHSKWANIKRKKEANDKKKGNIFSKLSRLITIAVIQGGGITQPENNVSLRLAIEKAQQANMPKENIKRAIERALGPQKSLLKEIIYEGFAPYGVNLIIYGSTDNSNRTISEVKNILHRYGGKLGNSNSVLYQFTKCALITFNKQNLTQEKLMELAEKLSAFDFSEDEEKYYLYLPYEKLGHLKSTLKETPYETADLYFKPNTPLLIEDEKALEEISRLIEDLEELDDIAKVFTNLG